MSTCAVNQVKAERKEILLACLAGGMAYEDAKIASEKETAEAMEKAQRSDKASSEYNAVAIENHKLKIEKYNLLMEEYRNAVAKR